MKLCCRKKQSSLECHCDHSRQRQGQRRRSERRLAGPLLPNERPIILLTLSARLNLLIVPYVTVPLLISLVLCCLCCLLSAASNRAPSQPVASLNWNCNEFCASLLLKCTFLRRSLPLLLCALLFTSSSTRRRRQQLGSVSKLPCHALLMATLTATFLLLTVALNVRPVSAQSLALLGTDSADSYEHEDDEDNEQTAYPTIIRLKNDTVSLPCNISQTKEEENSIKLILWYKNNILGTPIYSIDARDTNISQARHFVAPPYQGRVTFELNLSARLALLVVRPLAADDEGHYICRVDFRWTRTTVSTVKLDVIVPPERLRVIQVMQQSAATLKAAGNGSSFEDGGSGGNSGNDGAGSDGKRAKHRWGSLATRQRDNGDGEMHGGRPTAHQHPVLAASVLSIVHNGLMINEVETVRQPEETELTLFCDSIGGRPRSIVKWYRLVQWENRTDISDEQLYAELQSKEEGALQLIDDSFAQLNQSGEAQFGGGVNWQKTSRTSSQPISDKTRTTFPAPAAATATSAAAVTNGGNESQWPTAFVRNELHLGTVEDANHGQLYLCRTSNSNLSKPLDSIVRLQIYTRPKSIQIRQKLPPKDFLLPSPGSSSSSSLSPSQRPHLGSSSRSSSNSHDEAGSHLVRNRTLHSIELLDYYLNAKQPLIMQPFRLRSGFQTDFICRSSGSRPPARILWSLSYGHATLQKDLTQLSSSYFNGEDTLSLLHFVPKFTDNKVSLTCRACNEALAEAGACLRTQDNNNSGSSQQNGHHRDREHHYGLHDANKSQTTRLDAPFQLETTVLLDVNYKPIVSVKILNSEQMYHEAAQSKTKQTAEQQKIELKKTQFVSQTVTQTELASSSNYHQFREMQEIFFNCSINANPQAHLVLWFFNGKALQTDLSKGVIITNSNRTMIISSALRSNAGYFHCTATNLLGETESERHQIDVLFEPQCRVNYMQTSYHQLGDIVQLKCQVLANPADNLQFSWQFNGTSLAGHHANHSNAVLALKEGHSWAEDEEGQNRGRKQSSAEQGNAAQRITKLASAAGDKLRAKQQANLPEPGRTTATHISSQQLHLITNVIRIELNKWSSFGHFSCHSTNSVGQQKEGCKWHIVPSHYQPPGVGKHLNGAGDAFTAEAVAGAGLGAGSLASSGPAHHHRYHHRHHQQQSLGSSSHHSVHSASTSSSSSFSGTLNNCQIIESSNAVVIKCLETAAANDQREQEPPENSSGGSGGGGAEDFLAQVGTDSATGQTLQPPPMSATIDRGSPPVAGGGSAGSSSGSSGSSTVYNAAHFGRVNHAEIPTRLTYHVQVFRLAADASLSKQSLNSSVNRQSAADLNSKSAEAAAADEANEAAEQQLYYPQIDQPEPVSKRVASKPPTSSSSSSSSSSFTAVPAPILVMDTINFTNPLFIITNLSASTNYLLKIWSSKAHSLDGTLEQVNITVRTRPNDDTQRYGGGTTSLQQNGNGSNTLAALMQMSSQKLMLLVALVAFICAIFVALIVISAVFKIRAILEVRKARRAVNVNESISALETALCEMRPEKLENDLKSKNHFSVDNTYRPYISVENVAEEDQCIMVGQQSSKAGESGSSRLNHQHHRHHHHQYADSSLITYPNYLYPSMAAGSSLAQHKHSGQLKLNCSDEESVSTSNTSASNRTNTTESTNANSNYTMESKESKLELHFGKHCHFPPPVTLDSSSMLFCMDHDLTTPTTSSHPAGPHAFLVPEGTTYHSYPLQLHILPEAEEGDHHHHQHQHHQSVTVVGTPSGGEQCTASYLPIDAATSGGGGGICSSAAAITASFNLAQTLQCSADMNECISSSNTTTAPEQSSALKSIQTTV